MLHNNIAVPGSGEVLSYKRLIAHTDLCGDISSGIGRRRLEEGMCVSSIALLH